MRNTIWIAILATGLAGGCTKKDPKPAENPSTVSVSTRDTPPLATGGPVDKSGPAPAPTPLPQEPNPSSVTRTQFYHLAEGSEIYPLAFLRALYARRSTVSFMEPANLERYGLLPDATSPENPKGLSIGMTIGEAANPALAGFYVVGFNCAACHVGRLEAEGKQLTLDGAPNMFNIKAFNRDISEQVEGMGAREWFAFFRRIAKEPASKDMLDRSSLLAAPGPLTRQLYRELPTLEDLQKGGSVDRLLAASIEATIERERVAAFAMSIEELRAALIGNKDSTTPEPAESSRPKDLVKKKRTGKAVPSTQTLSVVPPNSPLEARAKYASADLRAALSDANVTPEFFRDVPKGGDVRDAVFDLLIDIGQTVRWVAARAALIKAVLVTGDKSENTTAGPGRVDAFNTARNLLFPSPIETTAPVCYPHLWGFAEVSWLHWDANTDSSLERNMGQALGLGAVLDTATYKSSVQVENLHKLESFASKISAPKWPFTAPDPAKVARGEGLYKQHCYECHAPGIGKKHEQGIQVGTDPERLTTFNQKLDASHTFVESLAETLEKSKKRALQTTPLPPGTPDKSTWRSTKGYAKRSLEGIWASPPYLHNGSVPSLVDLLKKASDRPATFKVGSRRYDVAAVGYVSHEGPFDFVTSEKGNLNGGHEYGTELGSEEKAALVEYMKTL